MKKLRPMSAIAILTKAEIMEEKLVPRQFMGDQHREKHKSEMQELFQMKYTAPHYGPPDFDENLKFIVGNVDWRLKIDEDDPRKSTICELWLGKSSINQNEWHFLPLDSRFFHDLDYEQIFIVKNFMIITFMNPDGWKYLFLNLLSKKLFWIRGDELNNKIALVLDNS